jgi:hypothetical protein
MTVLPAPPLTIDQLHLLAADNTVGGRHGTFADLDIEPRSFTEMLDHSLSRVS